MSKIVSIRKVANDGLQAEMIDSVSRPGRTNVLAALNKGDERFNVGNKRRGWFPVTLASLLEMGVSSKDISAISDLPKGEKFELSIENPTVDGVALRLQVRETVIPTDYQAGNTMKAAKQIMISKEVAANKAIATDYDLSKYEGQNGYFMSKEGNFIFSEVGVTVEGQIKSVFVEGATLVPEKELASYGATLAEPVSVFQDAQA